MSQTCDTSGLQAPPRETSAGRQVLDDRGTAASRFNHGLKRAGSPVLVEKESDPWRHLLRLVAAEYPYCTMYGVNIVDGNIVSCENIQQSLTFGPASADAPAAPAFDEYWDALRTLCGRIRNGRLAELRFNRGKPISAKTSEGGRRFKRLVKDRETGPDSATA